MHPMRFCSMASLLSVLAGLVFAAPVNAKVHVVATIFPLADIVQQIGQDYVEVTTLLPPGASPHTFEPSPSQIRALAHADLFARVGAGLDDWMDKLGAAQRSDLRVVTVSENITLLSTAGIAGDPHVWLDPTLVRDHIVPALAAALGQADAAHTAEFERAAAEFRSALTALDAEIQKTLAPVSKRNYIGFHSAWGYFGRRYGLHEIAAIEPFPGKEPSAQEITRVIEQARSAHVQVLLVEPQFPARLAEQIARDFGGRTLLVDEVGGATVPGRDHYVQLMRYNAQMFAQALQ
jgi:ABC-type Zn uptake system ZnuABC Zn-binding protein ZnuA